MKRTKANADFSSCLIGWQTHHGRNDLPWQNTRDPYRIWLSEIMLQQTQVATVIPYYQRFLKRFPDVKTLASATLDEVLALWSGLGYYSRARNLHAAARRVEERGGFPDTREELEALNGIGRSTAAAIAVFSAGRREAILDGNVKRVLARHFAIAGYPGETVVAARLWSLADSLLPETGIETYTQALMDLGAGICNRGKPRCGDCPVNSSCMALAAGDVAAYPGSRPRKPLPRKSIVMPIIMAGGKVLLVKRPPTGIWGGLLCFPEFAETDAALREIPTRFGCKVKAHRELELLAHGFTHFSLSIRPVICQVTRGTGTANEPGVVWLALAEAIHAAIPAPVRSLLVGVAE